MSLNISTKVAEDLTNQLSLQLKDKLREFKLWAQVKGPKVLGPALSYSLDWLSPELLGTGFRIFEVSENELAGVMPFHKSHLDFQGQIHQGLMLNAALEMSQIELRRQFDQLAVSVVGTKTEIHKNLNWNDELIIVLQTDSKSLDEALNKLQKTKSSELDLKFKIFTSEKLKQKGQLFDQIKITTKLESRELIS